MRYPEVTRAPIAADTLTSMIPTAAANLFSLAPILLIAPAATASPQSSFGGSVTGLGDVNKDGAPDYAVGDRRYPEGWDRGAVWVFSGADHSVLYKIQGTEDEEGLGLFGASIGDVNEDGVLDLLIDARDRTTVRSGADGAVLFAVNCGPWSNIAAQSPSSCSVGDVNGDRRGDFVLVGLPPRPSSEPGRVVMISGADGSELWSVELKEGVDRARFPASAAGGADFDRDGIPDVVVGVASLTSDLAGAAHILSGSTGAIVRTIHGDLQSFGTSVALLQDLNGDGTADVAVSATESVTPTKDPSTGRYCRERGKVSVHSGADGKLLCLMSDPSPTAPGESWGSDFGARVVACGDLDGDATEDLLISDPRWNASVGAVYAFSVRSSRELYRVTGDLACDDWGFGVSLAPVGDLDKDGRQEFLVGCTAPHALDLRSYASVFSGGTGAWRRELTVPK